MGNQGRERDKEGRGVEKKEIKTYSQQAAQNRIFYKVCKAPMCSCNNACSTKKDGENKTKVTAKYEKKTKMPSSG